MKKLLVILLLFVVSCDTDKNKLYLACTMEFGAKHNFIVDFSKYKVSSPDGEDFITINISEKEFVFQAYLTVDGRDFGKTTYTITRPTNKIKITSVIHDNEGPW